MIQTLMAVGLVLLVVANVVQAFRLPRRQRPGV